MFSVENLNQQGEQYIRKVNSQSEWFLHVSCFFLITLGFICEWFVAYISCFLCFEHIHHTLLASNLNMMTFVRGLWPAYHISSVLSYIMSFWWMWLVGGLSCVNYHRSLYKGADHISLCKGATLCLCKGAEGFGHGK